jgi:putative ABC transport system substrate-binding protein
MSLSSADLSGKRLEALKELVPGLRRVAVLWERSNPGNQIQLKGAEAAARVLGLDVQSLPVQAPNDLESAFRAARSAGAVLAVDAPMFGNHRTRLVALAASGRLPAIYGFRAFVEAGGLMSYGVDVPYLYAGAGIYVDKILKGAKPADLPVEQPTKFELVINLKTAKALGLSIPPSLLLRADQVLE